MKIEINNNIYDSGEKFSFSKVDKDGEIISSNSNIHENKELDEMVNLDSSSYTDENDINRFNIIIDDNDCSDSFFDDVCDSLSESGIKFKKSKSGENINFGNCLVITLDQQYSSGFESIIFAPFNNARIGESDALALSMYASFKQGNISTTNILCGKSGYNVDENGNFSNIIPTDTETKIDENHDTSFVTISFGTQNMEASTVAECIRNGLARYVSYINNCDSQTDLIYRSTEGEDVKMVAEYFGATPDSLSFANKLENKEQLTAQAVINPAVKDIDMFNPKSDYSTRLSRKI